MLSLSKKELSIRKTGVIASEELTKISKDRADIENEIASISKKYVDNDDDDDAKRKAN
jgi:hypothetical protein